MRPRAATREARDGARSGSCPPALLVLLRGSPRAGLCAAAEPRRLLERQASAADLAAVLASAEAFRPYPTIADREAWAAVLQAQRAAFVAEAERQLGMGWPAEANVASWRREVTLDRAKREVVLAERFAPGEAREPVRLHLLTPLAPDVSTPGRVTLARPATRRAPEAGAPPAVLLYDHGRFTARAEEKALDDARLRACGASAPCGASASIGSC
jgi:hypothetical protein